MRQNPRVVTLTLHPAIDRVVNIAEMRPGATFDGKLHLAVPAGKGVNTARSLHALCAPSLRIVTAIWAGAGDADFFKSRLREAGIECAVCPRSVPTRRAHTFLEATGRETHIKETMPAPSAAEQRALLQFCNKAFRAGDIVAVCGSAPAGTPLSMLRRIFKTARKCGAGLILADTNGAALTAAGAAGVDILKGNAAEIGAWLQCSAPFDSANTRHLRSLRSALLRHNAPEKIVITLGAAGVMLASKHELLRCALREKIDPHDIVSVTGCGDAATAGILWSLLLRENSSQALLARAAACGAVKLFSADPGKLSLKSVQHFVRYCESKRY